MRGRSSTDAWNCPTDRVWIVVDVHDSDRIVTSIGMKNKMDFKTGISLERGMLWSAAADRWISKRIQEGKYAPMLITGKERLWIVDPRWYLSTGCMILFGPALHPHTVLSLGKLGMLGRIACYPAVTKGETQIGDVRLFLDEWHRWGDCLPDAISTGMSEGTIRETIRLIHAIDRYLGADSSVLQISHCLPRDREVRVDLVLFSAILMMVRACFTRHMMWDVGMELEPVEDDLFLRIRGRLSTDRQESPAQELELVFCRELAMRKGLIFEYDETEDEVYLCLSLTCRDTALLGIKTGSPYDRSPENIMKGKKTNGRG